VSLNGTEQQADEIVKVIKPQGKFGFIDDPKSFDVMAFKHKAVSTYRIYVYAFYVSNRRPTKAT
jgi:hypothetical protein